MVLSSYLGANLGFPLSTQKVSDWLTFAEGVYDLKAGDIDVDEAQSGQRSAEGGLLPEVLKKRRKCLKIIKIPTVSPGEDHQENTDLKGEQS